jgi:hypothetical protein
MFNSRQISRQRQQLDQLAAELRFREFALHALLRRRKADSTDAQVVERALALGENAAPTMLATMSLTARYDGKLHSPSEQHKVAGDTPRKDAAAIRAAQLQVIASEIMWYSRSFFLFHSGQPMREATHHDATELLKAMGL